MSECKYFTAGNCAKGADCKFLHIVKTLAKAPSAAPKGTKGTKGTKVTKGMAVSGGRGRGRGGGGGGGRGGGRGGQTPTIVVNVAVPQGTRSGRPFQKRVESAIGLMNRNTCSCGCKLDWSDSVVRDYGMCPACSYDGRKD
jgi:hypothetical protein